MGSVRIRFKPDANSREVESILKNCRRRLIDDTYIVENNDPDRFLHDLTRSTFFGKVDYAEVYRDETK